MNYHQLTGRGAPVPAPMPGRLIAFAVLLMVLLLGYAGWRIASARRSESTSTATRENKTTVGDERLEDAQNHLRHVQVLLVSIEQKQNRIHNRLGEVSVVLQQNYLDLEHRRINAADQVTQSVLRDAGEALDEVQLAKQSLAGGNR